MPRLPLYLPQTPMPSTSGVAAGVQAVPVVPQPFAGDSAPSALEQSLRALPQALEQTGGLLVQTEVLRSHQQKAQDTLDAKTMLQEYRQRIQETYNELLAGDYRTLPQEVVRQGKDAIADLGTTLTPQARALFTEDANQVLSVLQQHALGEYSRRRDQALTYTLTRELQQVQEAYGRATSPYEQQVILGQADDLFQRAAETGLVNGSAVAEIRKKMLDSLAVQRNETAIQANPEAMARQYTTQARLAAGLAGPEETLRSDLPTAPPEQLPRLAQLAREVSWQQVQRGWQLERDSDHRWSKAQQAEEANLMARMGTLDPLPEHIPTMDALIAEVNTRATSSPPTIRPEAQMPFLSALRSLKAAALKPREWDDPQTERRLIAQIDAAETPQQITETRMAIWQGSPQLKNETVRSMLNTLRARSDANHFSNLRGYRDGMAVLVGADVGEVAYLALMRQSLDIESQERQRQAMDIFRETIRELAQRSPAEVNTRGAEIAQQIRDVYMLKPQRDGALQRLRLPLHGPDGAGVQDEQEAISIIRTLPFLTDTQRQQELDAWRAWKRLQTAPVRSTSPPAGGALPRVPATR